MIVLWWIAGYFALSTIVTIVLSFFLGANGTDDEVARLIQRDSELTSTYYMLEEALGRPPTTTEVWNAAPPWFDQQEGICP